MTTPSKLIAVEEFFNPPARSRAVLSPDGTKVAYPAPWQGRLNVFVRDLDSDWSTPDDGEGSGALRVTADPERNIEAVFWTTDGRYLLFQQDKNGDENAHLYRIDLTRPEESEVDLTPYEGVRLLGISLSPHRPGTAYVQLNKRRPDLVDLFELDLDTGERTDVDSHPGFDLDTPRPEADPAQGALSPRRPERPRPRHRRCLGPPTARSTKTLAHRGFSFVKRGCPWGRMTDDHLIVHPLGRPP